MSKKKHAREFPRLEVFSMSAECTMHPDVSSGSLHFRFTDTCVEISRGENKIGSIVGCIGGAVELHDASLPGLIYTLNPKEIWNAYQNGLVKAGLKKKAALL